MNRTLLLALAVLLGLAGIAISIIGNKPPQPPPPRAIAIAKTDIPQAGIRIEAGMLGKRTVTADEARFAYDFEEAIGTISIKPIKAGQIIGRSEAKPIAELRPVEDLDFEIISFSGRFDEIVGGQLKPGVLVNIYGYREGQGRDDSGDVRLIANEVWVVDVRASTGEAAGRPTPTPSPGGGDGSIFSGAGIAGRREVPASIVTVAAEPEVVWHIIEALGAGRYQAWVTLAGNQAFSPTPTPEPVALIQPTYTPLPTYTPFPTPTPIQVSEQPASQATPEVAGTPTPWEFPRTGGDQPEN